MQKSITLFLMYSVIYANSLRAQDGYTVIELRDYISRTNWNRTVFMDDPNISGSPYLSDEFQRGEIYMSGKYKIPNIQLRYNLYNDEFQFKEKNTIMAIADPASIDKIIIGDEVFIYLDKSNQNTVTGYVKMWNSQLPAVITKMKVDFFEKEKPKPYVEPKPDRFERAQDKQYLMKSKSEIENISTVKKLIKSLGDHEAELTDFAKTEKISAGDPVELSKLLDYYNTLK